MPRMKREIAVTKVYHIIIRGINKQDIFLDKQDIFKFIKEIERTKKKYEYEIYAYSFMNDHVHFIIYDKNENVSVAIQSLNVSYCSYFNKKYERTGHLFENRFKSKIVEDISYLKNLVRYIHKNPENAGLKPYEWTSYNEYIYNEKIINKNIVLKLFGNNFNDSINNFKEFHKNYYKYQDYDRGYEFISNITDEEAIEIMKDILKQENLLKIQKYSKEEKYEAIAKILKIEGIKKEQISRIIGINRKTIRNIEVANSQKGQMPQTETSPMGNYSNFNAITNPKTKRSKDIKEK